jgi:tRNA pseudouridine38-40 synthase
MPLQKGLTESNIKLIIEYDGKNYFGWQRQKNKPTIQETIENSLLVLFPETKIKLTGAGRTDTGVHALNQTANFKIAGRLLEKKFVDLNKLVNSLNAILPEDITVKSAKKVEPDFHSRYSAKRRAYKYFISVRKKSFNGDKYYHLKTRFDIDLAKEFCKILIGRHSFKSMCKNKSDKHGFMSDVYYANVKKQPGEDGVIAFEICASRFLHSMVRAIVGMMIKVASGSINIEEFKTKFIKGEQLRIQYVPSNALILDKIIY